MRFTLLLCLLTTTVVQAQQSSTSSQPPSASSAASTSSPAPAEGVPDVVKLASQKVTIPAAQIPVSTVDGKEGHLGDYDAKVVVVSLWSTLSSDNSFLKDLEALHKSYSGRKDVAILALNVDMPKNEEDRSVIRDIAKENGVTFPMLMDKELKLMALLNEKLRPPGMERNVFVTPRFVLFSQKFEKVEQPPFPKTDNDDEFHQWMRKEVEKVRLRKK